MIVNINMKPNSFRAWILAARPKTLTAAAVPVMMGTAEAWRVTQGENFGILQAVLCFLFAFVMQIDANFVNDYFDCVGGRDDEERLGPPRACQQGWITLRAMRIAMVLTSITACIIGLPLAYIAGWELIAVGAACVLFCFLYTTTLASKAMGDILVLVFFGIVPVCFTYYVCVPPQLREFSQWPWLLGIASGVVIDLLLVVNNYRDIDNDARVGKKTLIVYIGREKAEYLYMSLMSIGLILLLIHCGFGGYNYILAFFPYMLHINTWNKMRSIGRGRELNKVLGETARNMFAFGVLASIIIILS